MKYPAKHNIAHELLNFADERGFSYGFVQHADSWINLEKLGASVGVYELDDVTVIWCALDQTTRQLRVVQ
jgi:hypothetical protein